MAAGVYFTNDSDAVPHGFATEGFAQSENVERLEANREQAPYTDSVGAIRGFIAVMGIYVVIAAIGFGGLMLWSWLR